MSETTTEAWWHDPKLSFYMMLATYVFGGAGIGMGIYGLSAGGGQKAVHYALPLAVGAVGVLAGIRHSVFHVSDARRAGVEGNPFYMIELGFANGVIGIVALVAFFGTWGVGAEVALMLTYSLYLGLAFFLAFARVKSKGFDGGGIFGLSMWAIQVIFMLYFAIAGAIAAHLL
jgi:hypothetical protein